MGCQGTIRAVVGLTLLLSCRGNPFRDPGCESTGEDPVPVATLGMVALFTEAGDPIEIPNAIVSCAQGSSALGPSDYNPEDGFGAVLKNGSIRVVRGDGTVFNYYTCGLSGTVILRRCSEPLRVRVEAPGCEPYERSFTWDENFDLNGPYQFSFRVPVRLRCAGDAGAEPSMRDIPALRRDSGNLPRDAGAFDAGS